MSASEWSESEKLKLEQSGEVVLKITPTEEAFHAFQALLQYGFYLKTVVGSPLKETLLALPDVSPEYLENRIQTIFLNGKAVDDLDNTLVPNGSTVALSAAMPGLVGATLRRGGILGSLRSSISCTPTAGEGPTEQGYIRFKLFNLLIDEMGPGLLGCGIFVASAALHSFLEAAQNELKSYIRGCAMNGSPTDLPTLMQVLAREVGGYCRLCVSTAG